MDHRPARVAGAVRRFVAAASVLAGLAGCSATVSGHGSPARPAHPATPTFSSVPAGTTPAATGPGATGPAATAPITTAPPAKPTPTPTRPTPAEVARALNTLTGGAPASIVVVRAGFEAITYDQTGHVAFWSFGSVWGRAGASTYPFDSALFPASVSATGAVLTGMKDATFIVHGNFSGDGSANAAAYTNGPNGWGVIKAEPNGNLISSGEGVGFSSIGLENDDYLVGGELETAECSDTVATAECGGSNRVLKFWAWNGHDFYLVRTAGLPR